MDEDSPKTSRKSALKTKTNSNKSKKPRPKVKVKNGFVDSFKNEWSLFWEGLTGSEVEIRSHQDEEFALMKIQPMTMKQIKDITKGLSEEKMKLNQKLESIHREIELNTAKLQSVQLMGGNSDDTLLRINELTDQGQQLTSELEKLDSRLNLVRKFEVREKMAAF